MNPKEKEQLRDQFAGMAMQALLNNADNHTLEVDQIAQWSDRKSVV